jgi:hypothetical protein
MPAQYYSRGCYAGRLCWIRDHVPEGETRVELPRGIRLSRRGCVLRLCVQGARTGRLNDHASARGVVHDARDPKLSLRPSQRHRGSKRKATWRLLRPGCPHSRGGFGLQLRKRRLADWRRITHTLHRQWGLPSRRRALKSPAKVAPATPPRSSSAMPRKETRRERFRCRQSLQRLKPGVLGRLRRLESLRS